MSDSKTPMFSATGMTTDEYKARIAGDTAALRVIDDLKRELAAADQRTAEAVRKCEAVCKEIQDEHIASAKFALARGKVHLGHPQIAVERCCFAIRAAFPSYFQEKDNER